MNTHDIELPPLPPLYIAPSVEPVDYPKVAQALMDYAREAIEADRKRRGEPVAFLCRECDEEGWSTYAVMPHEVPSTGEFLHVEPLYASPVAAPQPAEPVKLCDCERGHNGMGMTGRECDCPANNPQPAEPVSQHGDDAAVDAFAVIMKAKLKRARDEKGRGGWQDMSAAELSAMLREHVEKGDPVDVANLAMMLSLNGQRIAPDEPVKVPSDDVLTDALNNLEHDNYEQSYSGYKNRQADVELIRAALAAMGEIGREVEK